MKTHPPRIEKPAVATLCLALCCSLALAGCTPAQSATNGEDPASDSASAAADSTPDETSPAAEQGEAAPSPSERERVPLYWNAEEAALVGRQGTAGLWGTCGQCCIANTLNLVTGSARTEADVVGLTVERGLCDPTTGGMTLEDMVGAYLELLPLDRMDVHGYGGDYAPTIDEMAALLEDGVILNVGVYGEMMREGGHTGEGELNGTHWTLLHGTVRDADGNLMGFNVIDSASSITFLTAQELSDIYYGHDGTTIIDPAVVEVYGWE